MDVTVESLVESCSKLISFPEVAIRVNEMVNDPDASATDIGKVISQDPALTTALLKVANSPLYGFSREVDTVSRAVALLGGKQIRDLTLATSAENTFKDIPNELLSMDDFWYHSLCCALSAQELADLSKIKKIESVFIAGLLHDIGQLVIFHKVPDMAVKSLMQSLDEPPGGMELYQAEREVMGFDHAQLGAALVKSLGLPESLQTCIAFHHEPSKAEDYKIEVALTHIANSLACLIEINSRALEDAPPIDPVAWEITGLSEDVVDTVIETVSEKVAEMKSALTMGG